MGIRKCHRRGASHRDPRGATGRQCRCSVARRVWRGARRVTRTFPSRLPLALFGVLVCFFLAAPLLIIVPLSFTQSRAMEWPPVGFTVHWYETVLSDAEWRSRVTASFEVGMGAAALAAALGVPAALALVRGRFPG